MDPFRDELAAAHAKITQLEDLVRALHERPPSRESGAVALLLVGLMAFFVAVIGIGALLMVG